MNEFFLIAGRRGPRSRRQLLVSSILCGGLGIAVVGGAGAMAQTVSAPAASQPSNAVEEVVVTAERRPESIQNVPISITAVSSDTIQKFDIQDFSDYAKLVPNLSYGMGVGAGGVTSESQGVMASTGISIRGISGYNTTAFYIDDTPVPESLDPRILDIDHIEVLRGPQGTLFGASSMGGLVRVITQPADMNTFSGVVDVQGYDMDGGGAPGAQASAVVNVPLIPDLASVRLSAFDSYTPGFFKRTYNDPQALNVTGEQVTGPAKVIDNVGAKREDGLGATFRITPIQGLVITPILRWQHTSDDGLPLAEFTPDNLVQRRILNEPEYANDQFFFAALTGSYTTPIGRFVSSTSWLNREDFSNEDAADANTLTFSEIFGQTLKLLPDPAIGLLNVTTVTEEDRFESNFNFPVQVVTGIFYQDVETHYVNNIVMPGLSSEVPTGSDTIFDLTTSNSTTQLAGYVGLTYTPFKALQIELGGRESVLTNKTIANSTGFFGTGPAENNASQNAFTPRASIKYNLTPDAMVYATAAQGFRVGGANSPLGSACAGLGYNTSEQIPYGSDSLWSYEAGIKGSALDKRVSYSADVYHIDWSKIQQTVVLSNGSGGCYADLTLNLGAAKSDGVEFETAAKVTKQLSLHAAAGYEDARLTSVTQAPNIPLTTSVGEPLNGVPKWTASTSADYEIPQPWGGYFIRGQYGFTGQSVSYTEVASGLARKAYEITDLRLGANVKGYTFTVFAKNVFNSRPNLSDEIAVGALAADRYRFSIGAPREVGLDLRYHF
jgi:outer membrane receptor protein involved in Fe transport